VALPDLSVIIPVYNRGDVIRYMLESVRRASAGLAVETIIVDDGSMPPTAETMARLGFTPSVLVRQTNQGLLFARLAGFARATGRNVLFLDSDDLVGAEKFHRQLAAMEASGADISYSDIARCEISGDYDALRPVADAPALDTTDGAEFCIVVQPPPHSPIFRTAWLRDVVERAIFPPSPLYNSVAEIWFYHNAAPHPARAVHVAGPHTIIGAHSGARLTNHWEKLAVASLGVMEAFARHCPATSETARVRRLVGETAFRSWRRLPRGFSRDFAARTLDVWLTLAGDARSAALGGRAFRALAGVIGPVPATRLLRIAQTPTYESCRTMSDPEFRQLLASLPPAGTLRHAP
jgi:glycosyltransferase involved in cell wall biosynthesis